MSPIRSSEVTTGKTESGFKLCRLFGDADLEIGLSLVSKNKIIKNLLQTFFLCH